MSKNTGRLQSLELTLFESGLRCVAVLVCCRLQGSQKKHLSAREVCLCCKGCCSWRKTWRVSGECRARAVGKEVGGG